MALKTLTVAEVEVSFQVWGGAANETVILIHCGGGHSGWWAPYIPRLSTAYHVVTIDLTGHGDSGRRQEYSPEFWGDEIAALIRHIKPGGQASLVGHSLGGLAAIYAAARTPELVEDLVLIDPPVLHVQARQAPLTAKTYATQDEALARFRLRPPETIASAQQLREVAIAGLVQVGDRWEWKYDPVSSQRFTIEGVAAQLRAIQCPVFCIYGELSQYVDETAVAYISETVGRPVPTAVIARAYHHVPLDSPTDLLQAIEDALARNKP